MLNVRFGTANLCLSPQTVIDSHAILLDGDIL